jgi:CheY-like chemotaxis protein
MKKILVVDDQSALRRLVEVTLSDENCRVIQAKSGEEAIAIVKHEKPDLILMDVMMPGGINGIETTRILKQNSETKKCPIIMLTGMGEEDDIEKGFAAGAEDYFVKPFSPLQLIEKVDGILGR